MLQLKWTKPVENNKSKYVQMEIGHYYLLKSNAEIRKAVAQMIESGECTGTADFVEFANNLNMEVVQPYSRSSNGDSSSVEGDKFGYVIYDAFVAEEVTRDTHPECFL